MREGKDKEMVESDSREERREGVKKGEAETNKI